MEMSNVEIISLILGSNLVNSIVTWILSRKKNEAETDKVDAETDSTQMDNLSKQLEFYRKLVTDYKNELHDYIELAEDNRLELLRLKRVVGKIVNDVCLSKSCSKRLYMDDIEVAALIGGNKDEDKVKESIQGK